jgi:ADP-ribose pyrophosphatase YjhB (NUDIX family)
MPVTGPTLGASACIFRGDEVLLVRRGKAEGYGLWSLPGGRVHSGETLIEAAARELAEETGIEAELIGLAGCRDVIRRDAAGAVVAHQVVAAHAGVWLAGEPVAMDDAAEAGWFGLDDLASLALTEGAEDIIRRAKAMIEETPRQHGR